MTFYIHSNELQHHGVLGQRWGIRRYQNEDGSYTPKGRKHLQQDTKDISTIADSTSKIYKSRLSKSAQKKAGKSNLSEMSDDEIRQRINRMQLENQYRNLVAEDIQRGHASTIQTLETISSVVAVGSSIASLAMTTKEIFEGKAPSAPTLSKSTNSDKKDTVGKLTNYMAKNNGALPVSSNFSNKKYTVKSSSKESSSLSSLADKITTAGLKSGTSSSSNNSALSFVDKISTAGLKSETASSNPSSSDAAKKFLSAYQNKASSAGSGLDYINKRLGL